MHRPWEKHLSIAIALAAAALAVGELWNLMAGAAVGAVAFFVALRPLFRNRRARK
jgi:small-conductance mechanosensitive channel